MNYNIACGANVRKNKSSVSYKIFIHRDFDIIIFCYIENELRKEVERIRIEEERRKKMERNATAYEIWLRSSKNKPRPIPLNRGLDSLRASVSVSYVNPTPWEPNVERELDIKPTSQ